MIEDASCVVLVGGESRRMGTDKALVELGGARLVERVLDVVMPLFSDVMIGAHKETGHVESLRPGVRVVTDFLEGRGPALGVASALSAAKSDWLFVISCDVPRLSGELVKTLAGMRSGVEAVIPVVDGRSQTMCAFYSSKCLTPLTERVKEGRRSIDGFLKDTELPVRYVSEDELLDADPDLLSFMDVDTPEELEKARALFKES